MKRKLNELRKADLVFHLEKRGLEVEGLKAVLLERLEKAVKDEGKNPHEILFDIPDESAKNSGKFSAASRDKARDRRRRSSNLENKKKKLTLKDGSESSDEIIVNASDRRTNCPGKMPAASNVNAVNKSEGSSSVESRRKKQVFPSAVVMQNCIVVLEENLKIAVKKWHEMQKKKVFRNLEDGRTKEEEDLLVQERDKGSTSNSSVNSEANISLRSKIEPNVNLCQEQLLRKGDLKILEQDEEEVDKAGREIIQEAVMEIIVEERRGITQGDRLPWEDDELPKDEEASYGKYREVLMEEEAQQMECDESVEKKDRKSVNRKDREEMKSKVVKTEQDIEQMFLKGYEYLPKNEELREEDDDNTEYKMEHSSVVKTNEFESAGAINETIQKEIREMAINEKQMINKIGSEVNRMKNHGVVEKEDNKVFKNKDVTVAEKKNDVSKKANEEFVKDEEDSDLMKSHDGNLGMCEEGLGLKDVQKLHEQSASYQSNGMFNSLTIEMEKMNETDECKKIRSADNVKRMAVDLDVRSSDCSPPLKRPCNAGGSSFSAKKDSDIVPNPVQSSRALWITGVSVATKATDLKHLFSKYGKVRSARIITKAPCSNFYGHVVMSSSEEATKSVKHLHHTMLNGQIITVEKTKCERLSTIPRPDLKCAFQRPGQPNIKNGDNMKRVGSIQDCVEMESEGGIASESIGWLNKDQTQQESKLTENETLEKKETLENIKEQHVIGVDVTITYEYMQGKDKMEKNSSVNCEMLKKPVKEVELTLEEVKSPCTSVHLDKSNEQADPQNEASLEGRESNEWDYKKITENGRKMCDSNNMDAPFDEQLEESEASDEHQIPANSLDKILACDEIRKESDNGISRKEENKSTEVDNIKISDGKLKVEYKEDVRTNEIKSESLKFKQGGEMKNKRKRSHSRDRHYSRDRHHRHHSRDRHYNHHSRDSHHDSKSRHHSHHFKERGRSRSRSRDNKLNKDLRPHRSRDGDHSKRRSSWERHDDRYVKGRHHSYTRSSGVDVIGLERERIRKERLKLQEQAEKLKLEKLREENEELKRIIAVEKKLITESGSELHARFDGFETEEAILDKRSRPSRDGHDLLPSRHKHLQSDTFPFSRNDQSEPPGRHSQDVHQSPAKEFQSVDGRSSFIRSEQQQNYEEHGLRNGPPNYHVSSPVPLLIPPPFGSQLPPFQRGPWARFPRVMFGPGCPPRPPPHMMPFLPTRPPFIRPRGGAHKQMW